MLVGLEEITDLRERRTVKLLEGRTFLSFKKKKKGSNFGPSRIGRRV